MPNMENRVRQILRNSESGIVVCPPANAIAITEAESYAKLTLSNDYRDFLRQTNGAWVGSDGIYGVPPAEQALDATRVFDLFSPDWKQENGWWPVASDGFGNYYVLMTAFDTQHVTSPVGFIETTESMDTINAVVASDFWAFLFFYITDRSEPPRESEPVWEKIQRGEDVAAGRWPWDDGFVYRHDPQLRLVRQRYARQVHS